MKYLIDAYAWIEYLEGSKEGEKVDEFLNQNNEIFITSITIAEVVSKIKRKNGNSELAYESMIKNTKIIEITPNISKEVGLFHAEIREKIPTFGLADAFLYIVSKKINAKIITGDRHFKDFKEVIQIRQ